MAQGDKADSVTMIERLPVGELQKAILEHGDRLVTIGEAAKLTGFNEQVVRAWVDLGALPKYTPNGGHKRVLVSQVFELIDQGAA